MRDEIYVECLPDLNKTQLEQWCAFLATAVHQHPRQSPLFAVPEAALGRQPLYAIGRRDGKICAVALISLVPHPFLPGTWARGLCLSGPVCDDAVTMMTFLETLAANPCLSRVGALHVTPYWLEAEAEALDAVLASAGWRVAEPERYRRTGLVDITRPPEQILAELSKSARREVRRAERQGVTFGAVKAPEEALTFMTSLNRLRLSRGLDEMALPAFMASYDVLYANQDLGNIIGAWKEDVFLGGLLVYRSRDVVHGRHFTTEPEDLRRAGNLRIAPALWLEAMKWAQSKGCRTLDVEGYDEPVEGDKKFNIYKYKSEMNPRIVTRISERAKILNATLYLTGNARQLARSGLKRLKSALQ